MRRLPRMGRLARALFFDMLWRRVACLLRSCAERLDHEEIVKAASAT
jgi:hypothetical protein